MDGVLSICDRVMVLNYGETISYGKPREAISDHKVVAAYLGNQAAKQAGVIV